MKSRFLQLLFLGASGVPIALAQSPGTFTATGNLNGARQFHTATLLTNGKVLIAGGEAIPPNPTTWARAELYDPSTGTFTATSDMTTPRYMHAATLLPNGKVLIAGGRRNDSTARSVPSLSSAELYDPATGTFSATHDMAAARWLPTATLLNSGQVLIAGGYYNNDPLRSAELYDPSAGTFTPTGDMTEPGAETATLLPNGKVLITRSLDRGGPNHAELYDPATGTFTRTGDMLGPYQGVRPVAALLANGKVLIAGGSLGDVGGSTSAEIYDPATGGFSATGKMTADIDAWAQAVLLPEGRVLIAGRSYLVPCDITHIGPPYPSTCPGTAVLYDPVTGTFSAPAVSQSMEGHAATLLPDGTILLDGGFVCCGFPIASAEIYHPAVLVPSPVLFSLPDGVQGAILHSGTHQIVSSSNPAIAGEALEIYGAGLIDGSAIPPQVAVGGRMADVLYFGKAPGFSNLNQVNVRVPGGVTPGPAVPVRLTYLSRPSNEVTIGVQ